MKIPVITHEQTPHLGLSNKIICRFAKVLCLSFKETKGVPKGINTVFTGLPLRESLFTDHDFGVIDFGNKKLPLIYITGGNLGSRIINKKIGEIIPMLFLRYRILHQCGNANDGEDFKYLTFVKNSLPLSYKNNYKVLKQINPSSMGIIYKNASLVIGRSGANTVAEILAFGVPALLIPLPWAGQNEQSLNAEMIKSKGLGEILPQSEITPQLLSERINLMMDKNLLYRQKADVAKKFIPKDSLEVLVRLIDKYCGTN